ncbi:hypothetical protein CKO35_13475 [Ectothiorhodospira shaposhnikovii]|uniref:chorismate transformation enzyme, FkbO/Hyg5 family n=1 Tax=Ectothiorhodospira shaposhnikovii TaxID=1054 RepID=UPI0019063184|nr:hypothetical protein [Ectothiorhodospira shaposhnikovii]MBK1674294.1 hypothetical protein [Ectothiorhodospira shaposhnikovii]
MAQNPHSIPLTIRFQHEAEIPQQDARRLALIRFGQANHADPARPMELTLALPPLATPAPPELWLADEPVAAGFEDGIGYSLTGKVLFGWILVDEADFDHDMNQAAEYVYERLLAFHRAKGFPHLLRIWNYFPDIHRESDGLDRYQAFCQGRHRALERVPLTEGELPAATAIGTTAPGLLVYFLAGREPGIQIENPRQVSAFHYPRRYGPKSPSFSRATLKPWSAQSHLYISGTASIVGHETLHTDVLTQLDEIIENLRALIRSAGNGISDRIKDPGELSMLKVYVRHAGDTAAVKSRLEAALGSQAPAVYLRGDICRDDLLVEIEGLYA